VPLTSIVLRNRFLYQYMGAVTFVRGTTCVSEHVNLKSNVCVIFYGKDFTVQVIISTAISVVGTDSDCQICDC
jgi:hypothetical protein